MFGAASVAAKTYHPHAVWNSLDSMCKPKLMERTTESQGAETDRSLALLAWKDAADKDLNCPSILLDSSL